MNGKELFEAVKEYVKEDNSYSYQEIIEEGNNLIKLLNSNLEVKRIIREFKLALEEYADSKELCPICRRIINL